jgi:chemotaxis protein methyltransferase CheR
VQPEIACDPQLDIVQEFIQARTGLVFPPSRQIDVEACVRKTMEAAKIDDSKRFVQLIEADENVFDRLITSLTVSETYFFREPRQFEFIRMQILPELQRRRAASAGLHFWSAGCATGEEAYSLALLLEQERLGQRASILGTDISGTVLTLARKACYKPWSFRGNNPETMAQYFDRRNGRFVLQDKFRRRVEFRSLNLAGESYPSLATGTLNIDLILCRNVLIYFNQHTVARVARRLFAALADGGWLITGPSDPPLWDYAPFETKVTEAGVLYRRPSQVVSQLSIGELANSVECFSQLACDDEQLTKGSNATGFTQVVLQPDPKQTRSPGGFDAEPSPAAELPNDIAPCVSSIRVLADAGQLSHAAMEAETAIQVFPLAAELHYMRAIVLAGLGQYDEASASLRRVVYLDPSLAVAHFTLGSILWRSGAMADARRCYRNALALCAERPPQERLQLSEDETAGRMAEAARNQLAFIDGDPETKP